jgi:pre-mRNA-splicing factor 38A
LFLSIKDGFYLSFMDSFIDDLLRQERVCDIILPRIQSRYVLEQNDELEPRESALEDDLD